METIQRRKFFYRVAFIAMGLFFGFWGNLLPPLAWILAPWLASKLYLEYQKSMKMMFKAGHIMLFFSLGIFLGGLLTGYVVISFIPVPASLSVAFIITIIFGNTLLFLAAPTAIYLLKRRKSKINNQDPPSLEMNSMEEKRSIPNKEDRGEVIGRVRLPIGGNIMATIYCHIFFIVTPLTPEPCMHFVDKDTFYRYQPGSTIPLSLI